MAESTDQPQVEFIPLDKPQPPTELPPPPGMVFEPIPNPIPESDNAGLWREKSADVQRELLQDLWNSNIRLRTAVENYLGGSPVETNSSGIELPFGNISRQALYGQHGTGEIDTTLPQSEQDLIASARHLVSQVSDAFSAIDKDDDYDQARQEEDKFIGTIEPLFTQLLDASSGDQASGLVEQIKSAVQAEITNFTGKADLLSTSAQSIKTAASEEFDDFDKKYPVTGQTVTDPDSRLVRYYTNLQRLKEASQASSTDLEDTCHQTSVQIKGAADPVSQFLEDYLRFKFPPTT